MGHFATAMHWALAPQKQHSIERCHNHALLCPCSTNQNGIRLSAELCAPASAQIADLRSYEVPASSLWQSSSLANNQMVGRYYTACLDLDYKGVSFIMESKFGASYMKIKVTNKFPDSMGSAQMRGLTFTPSQSSGCQAPPVCNWTNPYNANTINLTNGYTAPIQLDSGVDYTIECTTALSCMNDAAYSNIIVKVYVTSVIEGPGTYSYSATLFNGLQLPPTPPPPSPPPIPPPSPRPPTPPPPPPQPDTVTCSEDISLVAPRCSPDLMTQVR